MASGPSIQPPRQPEQPRENSDLLLSVATSQRLIQQHWAGPYPPPEAAERYEKLMPGTFGRLLAMAEQQQAADIRLSEQAQTLTQRDARRGHWLGSLVSLAAIAGAVACALKAQPLVAVALVSVPVMAVGRALVEGFRRSSPEVGSQQNLTGLDAPSGGGTDQP